MKFYNFNWLCKIYLTIIIYYTCIVFQNLYIENKFEKLQINKIKLQNFNQNNYKDKKTIFTSQSTLNFNKTNILFPTILIGIMITENTSVKRLNAFRDTFFNVSTNVNLIFKFVQGKSEKKHRGTDVVVLNISENINDGKTYHWFEYGIRFLSEFALNHKLNGIVKMDIDCAVDWNKFLNVFFPLLNENYYIGRVNDIKFCGESHCPPQGCNRFNDNCWIYMSGGWYGLSFNVARSLILNCEFTKQNIVGYEDLMVGKWLQKCFQNVNILNVNNGDFFCHDNTVTNDIIKNFNSNKCSK